jgi:hypothetical protein
VIGRGVGNRLLCGLIVKDRVLVWLVQAGCWQLLNDVMLTGSVIKLC